MAVLEQEFSRDYRWKDWKGVSYRLVDEYAYVCGPAAKKEGCTPGTRDANNDGTTLDEFVAEVNEKIRARRALGHGAMLPEAHAFLTREEVIGIRLYSGPAYQPYAARPCAPTHP